MSSIVAVALVAAGGPANQGCVYAAEAVRTRPGGEIDRFPRRWVKGLVCPQELGRAAGRAPGEPSVEDARTLMCELLDWLRGETAWSLDPSATQRWLGHYASESPRPIPPVVDLVLAASLILPGEGTATASDVAHTLGHHERWQRRAGTFRAVEVLDCLKGLATEFVLQGRECPQWASLVLTTLANVREGGQLGILARTLRHLLTEADRQLLVPPLEDLPRVLPEDREDAVVGAIMSAGPAWVRTYDISPRPSLAGPSSTEELTGDVARVFRDAVPVVLGRAVRAAGEAKAEEPRPRSVDTPEAAQPALPGVDVDARRPGSSQAEREQREADAARALTERPGQLQMALAVTDALGTGHVLLAEAETGTGKTLAYLVPAALISVRRGPRVVISTFTRALQDQVITRDADVVRELSRVTDTLPRPLRVTMLKGFANYVCLPALVDAVSQPPPTVAAALAGLYVFTAAIFSRFGELPDAPLEPPELRDAVNETRRQVRSSGRCGVHRRTSGLPRCPHTLAREAAKHADVLVVNHAWLLFQDLGEQDVVVVDEADLLAGQAEDHFSSSTSIATLRRIALEVGPGDDHIGGRYQRLGSTQPDAAPLPAELARVGAELKSWADSLDAAIRSWANQQLAQDGEFEFRPTHRTDPRGRDVVVKCEGSRIALATLKGLLDRLRTGLREIQVPPLLRRTLRALERQLGETERQIDEALEVAGRWSEGADPDEWMLLTREQNATRSIEAQPLRVGPLLAGHFKSVRSLVFCSASLSVGGDFRLFRARTGVVELAEQRQVVRELRVASPFDYDARLRIGVTTDVLRDRDPRLNSLAQALAFTAERTRGRLLALFTSRAEMETVYRAVGSGLEQRGIPVYVGSAENADAVARRFRNEINSVALGVKSFWYGVDFPGETLEWLFIAKTPFEPRSPLNVKRMKAVSSHYDLSEKEDYYDARAMLELKQGIGRVLRRASDRGTVLIFDHWLAEEGRSKALRRVLPEGTSRATGRACHSVVDARPLADLIAEGFERHGLVREIQGRGLGTHLNDHVAPAAQADSPTLAPLVDGAADAWARGQAAEAWGLLQARFDEYLAGASDDPLLARGALLGSRALLAMAEQARAHSALTALSAAANEETACTARCLLLESLTQRDSALSAWQQGTDHAAAELQTELRALTALPGHPTPDDPQLAAWLAVLAWNDQTQPLPLGRMLLTAEAKAAWRLPAYVTCLHAVRAGDVPDTEGVRVAHFVAEHARHFGVRPVDLPVVLLGLVTGRAEGPLHQAAQAVLDSVDPDELSQLTTDALIDTGEVACLLGHHRVAAPVALMLDSRADEQPLSRTNAQRVLCLLGDVLSLALAHDPPGIGGAMRALASFASGFSLYRAGAEALAVLGGPGDRRELVREARFHRARLLAQDGEGSRSEAVALLVEEAERARASGDFEHASRALDEAWLIASDTELLRDADARLRHACLTVAPLEERAVAVRRDVRPGRYLVVGGDPALEKHVRDRVLDGVDLDWIVCERGQRPDYARVDALLTGSRFERVVLVTHHVSHALSDHVRRAAARLPSCRLVYPDLPGVHGVLRAMTG